VKWLAQAYSIDRWKATFVGPASHRAVYPSGGGETSSSLEARKSAASVEEVRDVGLSQT